eukprot:TRINITY_DN16016_c0_g1_i1.p1 TRINITY_DN16016_c0_g1~~TRINITY_DN16016_c0_g1_i1.p1  ORF type:complete len:238 (+),score=60.25 TRINITY_DN16016_c0_g1_i1:46-714(+)
MATNGEDDLADFLRREEEKFSTMEESAIRSSPPPDFHAQMDERERVEMASALIASIETSEDVIPEVTPARRSSLTYVRRPSFEFVSYEQAEETAAPPETGDSMFSVEPECIQSWRRNKDEMLEQKEAAASEEMRRWREAAQQELSDWYDHHNSQVETRKQDNRAAEEAFIQERDQSVPGTEWEKVANLCDFSAKGVGKNSRDVSRMRSIYLHLKENPPAQKV